MPYRTLGGVTSFFTQAQADMIDAQLAQGVAQGGLTGAGHGQTGGVAPTHIPVATDVSYAEVLAVAAHLQATAGTGGGYGGYMPGTPEYDAYIQQVAREALEDAKIQAAAQGGSALSTLQQQITAGQFSSLPYFQPQVHVPTPEYHPQAHYDYLAANPQQTIGLSPLQTGGFIPPGYSLNGAGQIQPGSGVGISGAIPPSPTQTAINAPRTVGATAVIKPSLAIRLGDPDDPLISTDAEIAASAARAAAAINWGQVLTIVAGGAFVVWAIAKLPGSGR